MTSAAFSLTATERAFLAAAVDALIPADDLSPSGSDCGVVDFIDGQLAGPWGEGSGLYRDGPFFPGKPEHGYQLALTPRELFRTGIADANAWAQNAHGKEFDGLAPPDRIAALKAFEDGSAQFSSAPTREFFEALLAITMEGFFADPIYGGNRDCASWKMIGYPGLPARYRRAVETSFGKRMDVSPRSIKDLS